MESCTVEGAARVLPDPRPGDLAVPLHHDVDAVLGEEVRREADRPLDLALGLPGQAENEGEVGAGRDAVLGEHSRRAFERRAGGALADPLETFVVAALGADQEPRGVRAMPGTNPGWSRSGARESNRSRGFSPRSRIRRAISVARAGFIENSSSTMWTQPVVVRSMCPRACSRRSTTARPEPSPGLAIGRAAERAVVRASA